MRLGAKILLGFMVTNVIIIALALSIFVFGKRADSAAGVLSDEILPLISHASSTQFSVAMQAFMTRDFTYTANPQSWEQAQGFSKNVSDYLGQIDSIMAAYPELQTPGIKKAVTDLEAGYKIYSDTVAQLPQTLKETEAASAEVTRFHGLFIEMCSQIYERQLKVHAEREMGTLKDGSLAGEKAEAALRRRFNRVDMTVQIMLLADNLLKEINLAQMTKKAEHIEAAMKMGDQLTADMAVLAKGSTVQIDIELQTKASEHAAGLSSYVNTLGEAIIASNNGVQARTDTMNSAISLASSLLTEVNSLSAEMGHQSKAAITRISVALLIGVVVAIVISTILAWFISASISKQANRLIDVLKEDAHDIDDASTHLSSASQELAKGATENAASLEETSAILEQITASTKELANDSSQATEVMNEAGQAVHKANISIGELTQAMDKILVSGNEISKIIKAIDEIAFQTNLLALNAAVEAARAGEAGAGFAVVAEEVRNLATRSADAAKNTSDLIEHTIASINTGSELVQHAVGEFKNIEEQSTKVSEILHHMAGATSEQANALNQINNAMLHIDKVTQGTAASSEEVSSMSTVLSNDATTLIDAVDGLMQMIYGKNAHFTSGDSKKPPKAINAQPKGANGHGKEVPMLTEF